MTESAKEIMGVKEISVVADKGYYDGEDIRNANKMARLAIFRKLASTSLPPTPNTTEISFGMIQKMTVMFVRKVKD